MHIQVKLKDYVEYDTYYTTSTGLNKQTIHNNQSPLLKVYAINTHTPIQLGYNNEKIYIVRPLKNLRCAQATCRHLVFF